MNAVCSHSTREQSLWGLRLKSSSHYRPSLLKKGEDEVMMWITRAGRLLHSCRQNHTIRPNALEREERELVHPSGTVVLQKILSSSKLDALEHLLSVKQVKSVRFPYGEARFCRNYTIHFDEFRIFCNTTGNTRVSGKMLCVME